MSQTPQVEQGPSVPAPPAPPALPGTPVVAGVVTDYRILQARRNELSRQLTSAEGRRERLLEELRQAPSDAVRAGVEARLKLLDERILQIERDIAQNGRDLAANPRAASSDAAVAGRPPIPVAARMVPLAGVFSIFVLAPLAFAYARRIWRGAPATMHRDPESDARLERMEQAVDAIAIEIERISEGQRFQNKLLGEGAGLEGFSAQRVRESIRVGRE